MKKLYLSAIAALLLVTGCTNSKPTSGADEETTTDPQEMEVEEENEVEIDEGDSSGGL